MNHEQKTTRSAMLETDFNRAADPISEAEIDVKASLERLTAMLDNGQALDRPLGFGPGSSPEQDTTADPLRERGKVAYVEPQLDGLKDYKSFADELDAYSTPPVVETPAATMSRQEIQAMLAKEIEPLKTPEHVFNPPPPTLGPGLDQARDDDRRADIAHLQWQLDDPYQARAAQPIDPLCPEPLDKAQADYHAAVEQMQNQDPEIEPE